MIEIGDLRVTKRGQVICHVPQLSVTPGQRLGITGANGSGKTTLLRVLGGLETDVSGRCEVALGMRRRTYVHQTPHFFRGSVLSNVTYGLAAHGVPRAERRAQAQHWLRHFGIEDLAAASVRRLSGGQQRRVALARALALPIDLLLLDEPLSDLDAEGADCTRSALDQRGELTVLIATPTPLPPGWTETSLTLPSRSRS